VEIFSLYLICGFGQDWVSKQCPVSIFGIKFHKNPTTTAKHLQSSGKYPERFKTF
jgi:hypothetical protein